MTYSREWLGVYRADAGQLLRSLRGALADNAATLADIELTATELGATIGRSPVGDAYTPDALDFGAPSLSYDACQSLALWLTRQGAAVVDVARTIDALQFSAPRSFVVVAIAPAPPAPPEPRPNRLRDLQREARSLGISWADVRCVAADLAERNAVGKLDGMRRRAAELLSIRGAWRRGLASLARRLDRTGQDSSHVAGWDCAAATIREEYPQFSGLDSCELFELVASVEPPPKPVDLYAEAMGWIEAHGALEVAPF